MNEKKKPVQLYDMVWVLSEQEAFRGLGLAQSADAIGALRLIEMNAKARRKQIEAEWVVENTLDTQEGSR